MNAVAERKILEHLADYAEADIRFRHARDAREAARERLTALEPGCYVVDSKTVVYIALAGNNKLITVTERKL